MSDDTGETQAILHYWTVELGKDRWWGPRDEAVDDTIRSRFRTVWERWRKLPPHRFLDTPEDALAALILFDQFPRNMFRGRAEAFATDDLARQIADAAIARGYDQPYPPELRLYFYMPFQHAESPADQDRSIALFESLGLPEPLAYARKHRAMIERFGRFPARNPPLGREDAPGEAEGRAESAAW